MASASSSQPNHTRFDVFLSFRGEDTRYAFTDHLYEALRQAGIVAFRDNDDIDRGEELTPRIEKGIKESKASIVVLSENYAKSKWCLHELLLILEQRQNFSHFVLPVLYHVDPSDVRNQRRSFLIEADDRVEGSKWTWVNVNRWKSALTEVANLAGMVAEGLETDFIKDIVDTINRKLNLKLVGTPAHLTAMETRAKHINSFLDNKEPGDNVLAIYGMGGAGKTTLAQYIYNANKQKFERSSFLLDIGLEKKQPYGLLNLKTQLINDMLGSNNTRIRLNNVYEDMHRIEEALIRKRVLIVLDDIDDNEQLNVLLGNGRAHAISKIIITTRNQEIQSWFKSKNQRCNMYGINKLNDGDSLELLSRHAFGSRKPMEGFEDVAAQLAQYCGGNPLALEVLGSSLYTNAEDMQGRTDMLETWRSTLNSLNSSKGDIHFKIQYVLKRSYDSLPYESQKALFLHIACFFVGEYKDYVAPILEPDWHAISGITNLINRCLITISPGNKLIMHQLLQEMARSIVIGESRVPATRSIVWEMSDSHELLRSKEGSETIEGLALDMRERRQNTTYDTQEDRQSTTYMILDFQNYRQRKLDAGKTSSLSKMKKLKLLRLIDVRLNGNYKKIPELRWLCRHKCYLKKIPSGLFMRSLVAIDMSNGECKTFKPPVVLDLLKILNLKGSHKLVGIHSLHKLPNLESLILWDCSSLTHLSKRIGSLKRLALLDLTGCKKLLISVGCYPCFGEENQRRLIFSLPASLKLLLLNDFLPEDGIEDSIDVRVLQNNQPQPFLYINLGNSQFEFLPKFVDNFKLRVLDLTCCPNLESLMSLPSTLEELYTYRCTSLKKITFQSARFSLRKFGYGGCSKLSEIQGLFKLVLIKELDEVNLQHIMNWIKYQDHSMDLIGDEITE